MSRLARHTPDQPESWDAPPDPRVVRAFPRRCLCSHAESLHYRDRKGRPNCIAVCACPAFRPDTVDGSISRHPAGKGSDGGAA